MPRLFIFLDVFFDARRLPAADRILTKDIPMTVDATVAIMLAGKNDTGAAAPRATRIAITVPGSSCREVEDSTSAIIMSVLALSAPSSRAQTALMPIGVAALPSPRKFAEIFIDR